MANLGTYENDEAGRDQRAWWAQEEATGLVPCPICEEPTPADDLSGGRCLDCWEGVGCTIQEGGEVAL